MIWQFLFLRASPGVFCVDKLRQARSRRFEEMKKKHPSHLVGVEASLHSFLGLTVNCTHTPWNLKNDQWTISLWFWKNAHISAVMACRYLPIYGSVNVVSKKSKSDCLTSPRKLHQRLLVIQISKPRPIENACTTFSWFTLSYQKTKLSQAWKIQSASRGSCRNVRKLGTHIFDWMGHREKDDGFPGSSNWLSASFSIISGVWHLCGIATLLAI